MHQLMLGDSLEVLTTLPDNFFDSIVTDPPAGISFMSQTWDSNRGGRDVWITWLTAVMKESLRVLKPGAHILVWALPKTAHWTATAIENAGFEVRDVVNHLFSDHAMPKGRYQLKPAAEHWILARKPIDQPSIKATIERYGTGGLQIDAARVGGAGGRWPANLVLSTDDTVDSPDRLLDAQSGHTKSKRSQRGEAWLFNRARYGLADEGAWIGGSTERGHDDEGGASRFFMRFIYTGKASNAERGAANSHPTVKALTLMQYLVLLITPPGGTVLDMFCGSGSTGVACALQGLHFVGIDQNADYLRIARERICEIEQC